MNDRILRLKRVSTHSRAEAAASVKSYWPARHTFQHTAARRRLHRIWQANNSFRGVSTHSRAEAAASTPPVF